MNALLVGADRLGNIPDLLAEYGIRIARHVTGRDPSAQRAERAIGGGIDIMILFTDFVGHNVMRGYRDAARRRGTRFVACRRSVCSLRSALDASTEACAACKARPGASAPGRRAARQ
ncbi:MAG: DUF2325 domain-containing protein [Limnobacter sp.]|nr:DUF2325 domain-containing protein [Limnobacter sp.]